MFKLVIEDDEGNKTVVPLIRDEISIGRQDGNTIRLTERNVSRRHAKILRENGAVFLEEIAARYGMKKNGERFDGRTEFSPGDVFSIGDYRLTLQTEVSPEAKPPAKPNGAAAAAAAAAAAPAAQRSRGEFSNQPTQITKLDEVSSREKTEVLPSQPAKLVIVSSNFAGQQFPLVRKEMVIGRGEECDIIIDHRSVSQRHAKVAQEATGEYKIIDLKSKNGVKVGGEEYRAVHLKRGDIVELGHVKFRFVEPGENYVFTPQAIEDDVPVASSNKGLLAAIGVVVVLAIIAGAFVLTSVEPEQVATVEPAPEATTVAAAAATPPEPTRSESAGEMLIKAEKEYLSGRVWEASGLLEAAKVLPDLSPDQVDKIDDLLSKVRREKPLARHYESGRDHFNQERWTDALRSFNRIPNDPPSNIYTLLEEERYRQRTVDKIIAEAEKLIQEDHVDDAKELAREVVANFDANYPPALEILEREDDKPAVVAVAAKKTQKKTVQKKASNKTVQKSAPVDPAIAEDAARASMMKGDWNGVVKNCAPIASKSRNCPRMLGVAYKNLNDTPNACKWFKQVGETSHGLDCP